MGVPVSCFVILVDVDENPLWDVSLGYLWRETMEVLYEGMGRQLYLGNSGAGDVLEKSNVIISLPMSQDVQ